MRRFIAQNFVPAVLLASLFALAPVAQAVECGDTVRSDVTLDRDLYCPGYRAALFVDSPDVTINLNGHTLRGNIDGDGIELADANDVSIMGPGRITGFHTGLYVARSHGLQVRNLQLDHLSAGVLLLHSADSDIHGVDFRRIDGIAVNVMQPFMGPMDGAGGHRIDDNRFDAVGSGVQLCGIDTGDSEIRDNDFDRYENFGVVLADNSFDNRLSGNRYFGRVGYDPAARGYRRHLSGSRPGAAISTRRYGLCQSAG